MNVTIIADASFCEETSACGWGFAIISDRGRILQGGSSAYVVGTSTEAELTALCAALVFAYEREILQRGDYLVLQSDCESALDLIKGVIMKKKRNTEYSLQLAARVQAMLKGLCLKRLVLRHVPGHTRGTTPRTFVNNKVDNVARVLMRGMRAHVKRKLAA